MSSLDEKLACLKCFAEEVTSANKMVLNDVASKVDPWIQGSQVPLDEAKDFLEAAQYLTQEARLTKKKLTMTRRYVRTKLGERLMHGGMTKRLAKLVAKKVQAISTEPHLNANPSKLDYEAPMLFVAGGDEEANALQVLAGIASFQKQSTVQVPGKTASLRATISSQKWNGAWRKLIPVV